MDPSVIAAGITAAGSIINAGVSTGASANLNKRNRKFAEEQSEKQRLWSEKMYAEQNAWNLEQWERTARYNSAQSQVERLRDAGLNPLYYGVDGVAAAPMEAAQPLSYDKAETPRSENPIYGLENIGEAYLRGKALAKELELKNRQIDKLEQDTHSVSLDNQFKELTMEARSKSVSLQNDLTDAQISKVRKEMDQISQNIKESIARTENETEKKFLIQAQTNLHKAQVAEIAALLPYRQLLMSAQTEAQKAAASASFIKAAIDSKLMDDGAIDAMVDEYKSKAKDAEARAFYDQFKADVRSGNIFAISDDDSFLLKDAKGFINSVFNTVGIVSEAILGPIAGLIGKAI